MAFACVWTSVRGPWAIQCQWFFAIAADVVADLLAYTPLEGLSRDALGRLIRIYASTRLLLSSAIPLAEMYPLTTLLISKSTHKHTDDRPTWFAFYVLLNTSLPLVRFNFWCEWNLRIFTAFCLLDFHQLFRCEFHANSDLCYKLVDQKRLLP